MALLDSSSVKHRGHGGRRVRRSKLPKCWATAKGTLCSLSPTVEGLVRERQTHLWFLVSLGFCYIVLAQFG